AASTTSSSTNGTAAATTPAGEGALAGQPATQAAHGPTDAAPTPKPPAQAAPPATDGKISIDDFMKVELRIGQVKAAEKIKGADKLLRLEVDIGTEVRQLVAGIARASKPE